jgi:hypothetical protein
MAGDFIMWSSIKTCCKEFLIPKEAFDCQWFMWLNVFFRYKMLPIFLKNGVYTEGSFDIRFRMRDFGKYRHLTLKIRNILRGLIFVSRTSVREYLTIHGLKSVILKKTKHRNGKKPSRCPAYCIVKQQEKL